MCFDISVGLPVVVTLDVQGRVVEGKAAMLDGVTVADCVRQLEEAGADVVGLNCGRGPETMIPLLEEIKKVCKVRPVMRLPYL